MKWKDWLWGIAAHPILFIVGIILVVAMIGPTVSDATSKQDDKDAFEGQMRKGPPAWSQTERDR